MCDETKNVQLQGESTSRDPKQHEVHRMQLRETEKKFPSVFPSGSTSGSTVKSKESDVKSESEKQNA